MSSFVKRELIESFISLLSLKQVDTYIPPAAAHTRPIPMATGTPQMHNPTLAVGMMQPSQTCTPTLKSQRLTL